MDLTIRFLVYRAQNDAKTHLPFVNRLVIHIAYDVPEGNKK